MVIQMVFSKVHPACHNIVNGIKPGSNTKLTDKHAANCSKAVYARCMNCSYNNTVYRRKGAYLFKTAFPEPYPLQKRSLSAKNKLSDIQ